MGYVSALDKARELGATVQLGINWDWAIGFTKENADKFIEFLNRYKFEHRGQYPGKEEETIDIRFRPQIVTLESNPDEDENLLLHSIPEVEGSPGIVVDEAVAKATPCTVYKVDTTEMAFSKGIIGTLSKGQIEAYCPTKMFKEEGIARRVKKFKEIAKKCSGEVREKYAKGERLIPYLKCMGKLAKEKEIEI